MNLTQPTLIRPSTWERKVFDGYTQPLWRVSDLHERSLLLRALCDPFPSDCEQLADLTERQWDRLTRWLHTSGLALYLLDRLTRERRVDIFPRAIHSALQHNLEDNISRTDALVQEFKELDRELYNGGVRYVVLKGFSLFPHSVPHPELRSQLDLDILIEPRDVDAVQKILARRGYRLHAISNQTWEFKTPTASFKTLNDLYRPARFETIELHVANSSHLLARAEQKQFRDLTLFVLPASDLLLGQALHLFKHLCNGFVRAAHFLEFRQSIIAQAGDRSLWHHLRHNEAGTTKSWLSLGLAINLLSQVMGRFAPAELTSWTEDRLPVRVCLWSNIYGAHAVLGGFPGNKLHLLLQPELQDMGLIGLRSRSSVLLPTKLPPAIYVPSDAEDSAASLRRHRRQISFVLFRLRFHLIEDIRYLCESFRWRRRLRGTVQ